MEKKLLMLLLGFLTSIALLFRLGFNLNVQWKTTVPITIIFILLGFTFYVALKWKEIIFERSLRDRPVKPEKIFPELKIDSIIPRDDYIVVKRNNGSVKLIRFLKVVDIPYCIEDMERDRKLWLMENVARLLSAINFECKLVHSIKPFERENYLKELRRKREEIQVKIDVQGKNAELETKLGIYDRLIERLIMGEQAFEDEITVEILASGSSEQSLLVELGKNTKTLQAMLESSLNLKTKVLRGKDAWSCLQSIFGVEENG